MGARHHGYPLAEVPDALRYLEAGQARGKVVISVPQPSAAFAADPALDTRAVTPGIGGIG